jgi:hypothetical protein
MLKHLLKTPPGKNKEQKIWQIIGIPFLQRHSFSFTTSAFIFILCKTYCMLQYTCNQKYLYLASDSLLEFLLLIYQSHVS